MKSIRTYATALTLDSRAGDLVALGQSFIEQDSCSTARTRTENAPRLQNEVFSGKTLVPERVERRIREMNFGYRVRVMDCKNLCLESIDVL